MQADYQLAGHIMQSALTLFILMGIVVTPAALAGRRVASAWNVVQKAATTVVPDQQLEYYVQVGHGPPDLGFLIAPIDPTSTGTFGETQLFAFNITQGADPASDILGSLRGYTIQTSSTADFRGVEVEILAYDNGSLNGTIILQGLISIGTNEVAIVGGTGDFRGARGYGIITFVKSTATLALFHHHLFFL